MTFIQLTIILRLVVEQIKSFNLLSTHLGLTQILCLIVFKVIFIEEYDTPLKLFKCPQGFCHGTAYVLMSANWLSMDIHINILFVGAQ